MNTLTFVSDTCLEDYNGQRMVLPGYFNDEEIEIFSGLIRRRLTLPSFHGDFWRCGTCRFESGDLDIMAGHITANHDPVPISADYESSF